MEENKNYCSQEDDEVEINLRLIFYNGLKNWRKLLLAGLMFGLLFGAGKGIKEYRAGQAARAEAQSIASVSSSLKTTGDELKKSGKAEETQYEDTKASLEYTIQSLLDQTKKDVDYKENSILMNLDPYHLYKNTLIYYIQTGDAQGDQSATVVLPSSDSNESYSGVANAYLSLLQSDNMSEYQGEDSSKDAKYLNELILADVDQTGSVLTIKVVGDSQGLVDDLTSYIKEKMNTWESSVTEVSRTHSIQLLQEETKEHSDINGDTEQISTADGSVQLNSEVSVLSLQNSFNSSLNDIQNQLNNLRTFQSDLQEPSSGEEGSTVSWKKETIKYGGIGFGVGILLLLLWYCLAYICSGKLREEEDLQKRWNVERLAEYAHPLKHHAAFDRFLQTHIGPRTGEPDLNLVLDNAAAVIDVKAGLGQEKNGSILLLSSLGQEVAKKAAISINHSLRNVKAEAGGNILHSAEAVRSLQTQKRVVLVEETGKTRVSDLEEEIVKIRSNGGIILGVLLM
jgi:uncharacterized protein YuzE